MISFTDSFITEFVKANKFVTCFETKFVPFFKLAPSTLPNLHKILYTDSLDHEIEFWRRKGQNHVSEQLSTVSPNVVASDIINGLR